MKKVVELLKKQQKTISSMESCTGGEFASELTNVEGASSVLKFSAVTYSNEYKIKLGVNEKTIKKYTVYSSEVANEMSKNIAIFSNSDYGIGITGQINRKDKNNKTDEDNKVYISIYNKDKDKYLNEIFECLKVSRSENKKLIILKIVDMLKNILNND